MSDSPTTAEVLRAAISAELALVHVAIPARVETYDAATQKVSVQPLIDRGYADENGARATESLPVIDSVPVMFPGANGYRVTFPIAQGDTVLLVFSEASLDKWLSEGGGPLDPLDDRRHTLSDAVAIPGLNDFKNALSDAPTDRMSIGRDGGATIEISATGIKLGSNTATQAIAFHADILELHTKFASHIHTGVTGGTTTSGPPAVAPGGLIGPSQTKAT